MKVFYYSDGFTRKRLVGNTFIYIIIDFIQYITRKVAYLVCRMTGNGRYLVTMGPGFDFRGRRKWLGTQDELTLGDFPFVGW